MMVFRGIQRGWRRRLGVENQLAGLKIGKIRLLDAYQSWTKSTMTEESKVSTNQVEFYINLHLHVNIDLEDV